MSRDFEDMATVYSDVESASSSSDEHEWQRFSVCSLLGRWLVHEESNREYSRLHEVPENHLQCDAGDMALPMLLGGIAHHSQQKATLPCSSQDTYIGATVLVDRRAGWIVTDSHDNGWTYDLTHPIVGSKSGVERCEIEKGIEDQLDREQHCWDAAHNLLPAWAFHEDLVKMLYSTTQVSDFLSMIIGPCIPVARAMAVLTFAMQVGALALGSSTASCNGDSLAIYPAWIQLLALPILVIRACAECWMLKYALSYFGRYIECFEIGGVRVSFAVWLGFNLFSSMCNFLDIVSDSLSSSLVQKASECNHAIQTLWAQVWEHSLLRSIPEPSLEGMVAFSWCLSLAQIVLPIIRTLRQSDICCKTQHSAGNRNLDSRALFSDQNLAHDDVFFGLADASGLAPFQILALMDAEKTCSAFHDHFERNASLQGLILDFQTIDHLSSMMMERAFLTGILETCVQTNIQSTLYAIGMAGSHLEGQRHIQTQQLFSLLISFVAYSFRWGNVIAFLNVVKTTNQFAAQHASKLNTELIASAESIRWKTRVFLAGEFIMIPCMLYAVGKVAMAHVCTDALWNISGCVDVHD